MQGVPRKALNPRHDTEKPLEPKGNREDHLALEILTTIRTHQRNLARPAALAWERAGFAQALSHPEPRRRIQAFLGEGK